MKINFYLTSVGLPREGGDPGVSMSSGSQLSRGRQLVGVFRIALMLLSAIPVMTACANGGGNGNTTTMEYMPDMMDSPAVKAQERAMRTPVAGTIPIDFNPYPYAQNEGDRAGLELENPLPRSRKNLVHGKYLFETYCAVCHARTGKGDGPITPKFPKPPTLHSKKVREWSDGRIFHVISTGQNIMPSYAAQVFPEERWAIIHYIRALQRSMNPTEADLKAFEAAKAQGWYPK